MKVKIVRVAVMLIGFAFIPPATAQFGDLLRRANEQLKQTRDSIEKAAEDAVGDAQGSVADAGAAVTNGSQAELVARMNEECTAKASSNPSFNTCAVRCTQAVQYLGNINTSESSAAMLVDRCTTAYSAAQTSATPAAQSGNNVSVAQATTGTSQGGNAERFARMADECRARMNAGNATQRMNAELCVNVCSSGAIGGTCEKLHAAAMELPAPTATSTQAQNGASAAPSPTPNVASLPADRAALGVELQNRANECTAMRERTGNEGFADSCLSACNRVIRALPYDQGTELRNLRDYRVCQQHHAAAIRTDAAIKSGDYLSEIRLAIRECEAASTEGKNCLDACTKIAATVERERPVGRAAEKYLLDCQNRHRGAITRAFIF